jgi:large subunit ribosomal protein L15
MSLFKPVKINLSKKKRVGRGISAGQGKTAGRGTKGQKSRTGFNIPRRFEGGQNSLISRIPKKKGFNTGLTKPITINTNRLTSFQDGDIISPKVLFQKGLIKSPKLQVKIVKGNEKVAKLRYMQVKTSKNINSTTADSKVQNKSSKI